MAHMEKRSTIFTTCFLLFLILALLPYFSTAGESEALILNSEIVYEIDYKGPETHSSTIPPPHHLTTLRGGKALGLMAPTPTPTAVVINNKVKKIHG